MFSYRLWNVWHFTYIIRPVKHFDALLDFFLFPQGVVEPSRRHITDLQFCQTTMPVRCSQHSYLCRIPATQRN